MSARPGTGRASPIPPDDWVRFEAQVQHRADFYGTEELDDEVAVSAVVDFLELERRLHAGTPPKGRRSNDLNLKTRIEPLYERLRQGAKSGKLSSFGVIRVKLLRITANRLAGRHDAARRELAEATADLVYNADPTRAWLDLLDRISEEWAHFDSAVRRGPHAAALSTASWLLPQVVRLGHGRPTPDWYLVDDDVALIPREGRLRASVLLLLADQLSKVDPYQQALGEILGVSRCPLLWQWLSRSGEDHSEWAMLARWGQAAFLRGTSNASRLSASATEARESLVRLSGLQTHEHVPSPLGRWDAITLDQQGVALRQLSDVSPSGSQTSRQLGARRRPALPVRTQGARADTGQRAATNRRLSCALRDVWLSAPDQVSAATLLKQAAELAKVSSKTVLTDRLKDYGECVDYGRARFLGELIEIMDASDRLLVGGPVLRFCQSLSAFCCDCEEPHGFLVQRLATELATPELGQMIARSPRELEEVALLRADSLREVGDPRWRHETEYAALHAATDGRPDDAVQHLRTAGVSSRESPSGFGLDHEVSLLTLAAIGDPGVLEVGRLLRAHPEVEDGNRFGPRLARGVAFARDMGHDSTADALCGDLIGAITGDADDARGWQLEVLGMLALDAHRARSQERLTRVRELAAPLAPRGMRGGIAAEVIEALSARARGDDLTELAALRAAWEHCSTTTSLGWSDLMTSPLIDRLTTLERTLSDGDPLRAEAVERRVASPTVTGWLDVVPPSEDVVWGDLVARGTALAEQDEFLPDPEDQDSSAALIPHTAVRETRWALADLTLALLEPCDPLDDAGVVEIPEQLHTLIASDRGLPIRVVARRQCIEREIADLRAP